LTSYPKCSKCEVHKGFYKAEQAVINDVMNAVKVLKSQFPNYSILITGHSLGAAMATLTSLDLISAGYPVRMINFGSPRVGNDEFSAYSSSTIIDHSRNTHYKDMVVHIPMHERFRHLNGEWYEDEKNILHACSGYEDNNCAYQWHITNVDDHMHYLGLYVGCDAVSSN
jgi:predicted lipase